MSLKHEPASEPLHISQDRVIAMAAPAFGQHSAYRNDIYLMSRFFATRHYGYSSLLSLQVLEGP